MSTILVVTGVSGSGKTTVGKLLAKKLNLPFKDADDYHPESNKNKMAAGKPLDDEDRQPWLETLSQKLKEWSQNKGAVLACSALKESYRKTLAKNASIRWIFLEGSLDLLKSRLAQRKGHFFDPALLKSQLNTLEIPDYGIHVSIAPSPQEIVSIILKELKL